MNRVFDEESISSTRTRLTSVIPEEGVTRERYLGVRIVLREESFCSADYTTDLQVSSVLPLKMSRRSFTAAFKLSICRSAEEFGNREAGRRFGVDESIVRRWRTSKTMIEKMPRKKKALRGRPAKWPQLEEHLIAWVREKRAEGHAISTLALRLKARSFAKEDDIGDFTASPSWAYRFIARHDVSVRRHIHISQHLPDDMADKITRFQSYIIKLRREHEYPLSRIGNANQTPLTFNILRQTTIAVKGERTVTINTAGHENYGFTVMLTCTADGGKLPPYVVFKRKTLPKDKFPAGVIVRVQQKGWMDEGLVQDWVHMVWSSRRDGSLSRQRSMLVLDAFRCSKTDDIKALLHRTNTDLVIIPGGMTSLLQPLDVSINKPFKDGLRRCWSDWIISGEKTYTRSGRIRKVDLPTICGWIVKVWEEMPSDIIKRAFLKCCISNSMDGTEDDIIWEEDAASDISSESVCNFFEISCTQTNRKG
uniref:HTH CENPB-type domain-containing protein n=1 Tax=Eptatretus burgeri TaxID=7764 RepID=A0A8C4QJK3_EPTBU